MSYRTWEKVIQQWHRLLPRFGPDAHEHETLAERRDGLMGGRRTRHSHPDGRILHHEHTVKRFAGGRTLHPKPIVTEDA